MSAAKPASKKASAKGSSGISYEAMIKEAILAHPEEKTGLGRPTIKKYIHQKHPETSKMPEAAFNNHVSKAITRGHEKKTFVLPKGISGRVKLAPDAKKAAVKKPAVKKAAATKTAKPAAAKKATTTKKTATKKAAPKKKTTSSTAAKAKKPAAKKTATTKKLTSRPALAPIAQAAPKKKAAPKKA